MNDTSGIIEIGVSISEKSIKEVNSKLKTYVGQIGDTLSSIKGLAVDLGALITLPTAGVVKKSLDTFAEYEVGMTKVRQVLGATTEEYAKLEAMNNAIAKSTKYSQSEIAETMLVLARAGYSTQEILDSIGTTVDGAIATDSNSLSAYAEGIITTNAVLKKSSKQAEHTNDLMLKTTNKYKMTVEDYFDAFSRFGGTGGLLGNTEEEMAVIIGNMMNLVKSPEQMTTHLEIMTKRLADIKIRNNLAKQLGVDVIDKETGNIKALPDIMKEITDQAEKLGKTELEMSAIFQDAFGADAFKTVMQLYGVFKDDRLKMKREIEELSDYSEFAGMTSKMSEELANTTQGKFDQLVSSYQAVLVSYGDLIKDSVVPTVEMVTRFLDKLDNLETSTKQRIVDIGMLILKISGVVAVVGILGTIVGSVGAVFVSAFGSMSMAITSLLAIGILKKPFEDFMNFINGDLEQSIKNSETTFKDYKETLSETVNGLGGIFKGYEDNFNNIRGYIGGTLTGVGEIISDLFGKIKSVGEQESDVIGTIMELPFKSIYTVVNVYIPEMIRLMGEFTNRIRESFNNVDINVGEIFGDVLTGFDTIVSNIPVLIDNIINSKTFDLLVDVIVGLIGIVDRFWSTFGSIIKDIAFVYIPKTVEGIAEVGRVLVTEVIDVITSLFNVLSGGDTEKGMRKGLEVIGGILNNIKKVIILVVKLLGVVLKVVVDIIGVGVKLIGILFDGVNGIYKLFTKKDIGASDGFLMKDLPELLDYLIEIVDKMKDKYDTLSDIIWKVVEPIREVKDNIVEFGGVLKDEIMDRIEKGKENLGHFLGIFESIFDLMQSPLEYGEGILRIFGIPDKFKEVKESIDNINLFKKMKDDSEEDLTSVYDTVKERIDDVIGIFTGMKDQIVNTMQVYLNTIKYTFGMVARVVGGGLLLLGDLLTGNFAGFKKNSKSIGKGIQEYGEEAVEVLGDNFKGISEGGEKILESLFGIKDGQNTLLDEYDSFGELLRDQIKKTLDSIWLEVKVWAIVSYEKGKHFIKNMNLFQVGKDLVQSLWDGVRYTFLSMKLAFKKGTLGISDNFAKLLGFDFDTSDQMESISEINREMDKIEKRRERARREGNAYIMSDKEQKSLEKEVRLKLEEVELERQDKLREQEMKQRDKLINEVDRVVSGIAGMRNNKSPLEQIKGRAESVARLSQDIPGRATGKDEGVKGVTINNPIFQQVSGQSFIKELEKGLVR